MTVAALHRSTSDVASTRRVIAQLEERKAGNSTAAQSRCPIAVAASASTKSSFQRIKIALAEAEANVAQLRSRVAETEGRLAQLRAVAVRAPGIEADLVQLNRNYDACARTTSSW